jgi:polyisoprenoid-binding protein YceI
MISLYYILLPLTFMLSSNQHKVYYTIEEGSKVTLDISTNLVKVSCRCLDQVNFGTTQTADFTVTDNNVKFTGTYLKLDVNNINCKNKGINNDLRETLVADKYPQILLELQSILTAQDIIKLSTNASKTLDARSNITIAGKKKPQTIKTTLSKRSDNTLRLQATKTISLEQYEIVPKSSLKFVKIHDNATITVDLIIKVKGI